MPVYCAQCREELFGAVNRCWKCGRAFLRPIGTGETPPQRRAPFGRPLPMRGRALEAVLVEAPGESAAAGSDPSASAAILMASANLPPVRTLAAEMPAEGASMEMVPAPTASDWDAAGLAAVGSLPLGLLAAAASLAFVWPLAIAFIAIPLAVAGLHSRRPEVALVGLAAACFAAPLSIYHAAVALYIERVGVHPLAW